MSGVYGSAILILEIVSQLYSALETGEMQNKSNKWYDACAGYHSLPPVIAPPDPLFTIVHSSLHPGNLMHMNHVSGLTCLLGSWWV